MKLWPPCSNEGFLASNYLIVKWTSVELCTLVKDEKWDLHKTKPLFHHMQNTIKLTFC